MSEGGSGPKTCSVCRHAQQVDIELALVQGESERKIAERFGYGKNRGPITRHKKHMAAGLTKARDAADMARADTVLAKARELEREAREILVSAKAKTDPAMALQAIDRIHACLKFCAQLTGELASGNQTNIQVNVLNAPEWPRIKAAFTDVLGPYPELLKALIDKLEGVHRDRRPEGNAGPRLPPALEAPADGVHPGSDQAV